MKRSIGIEQQLSDLRSLGETEPLDQYQKLFGAAAPVGLSRELLQAAVGYRLQKALITNLRHRMMQAVEAGEAIVSALSVSNEETVLIREWRGHCHVVTVTDGDVWYQGERHQSLSAVAQVITGKVDVTARFFGETAVEDRKPQSR